MENSEKPFQLTPKTPDLDNLIQGEELIGRITRLAHSRKNRHPVLVSWSFRCEKEIHSKLQTAADKLEPLAMADIVNGLLEMFLPVILAQRASPQEKVLADPDQRAHLAGILASLTSLLQKG